MRKFVPFVAVAALVAAAPMQAQSCDIAGSGNCTVGTTASMTMPSLLRLTLGSTTSSLSAPAAVSEFDADGVVQKQSTGPSVTVRANRGWAVTLQADAATFTAAGGSSYAKPISDLEVSKDGGSSYSPISNSEAFSITSGTATASSVFSNIRYRTRYSVASDAPGTYSLGITYTLTAN
jgi:hypothetical protein